jgi:PAS domain S-box-containing protein
MKQTALTGDQPLPIAVERTALLVRYVLYFLVAGLVLADQLAGTVPDLIVVGLIVLGHNSFAHYALYTQRYYLFFTRFNFFLYLLESSFVVYISGADTSSEVHFLYVFMIIGFSAYVRDFWKVMGVSILCTLAFALVIFIEWLRIGLTIDLGILVVRGVIVLVCGWLVASLSQRLADAETTQRRQRKELAASEATLRTILNSTADPIVVFDDHEFIQEANEPAWRFFGLKHDELMGQRIRAFLFDDGTLPQKMSTLRTRGQGHDEEIFVNAQGEECTVEVTVRSFLRDDDRYYVALFRDVTQQKNLQEATRMANLNLERLNRELRQVDELKTGFLTTVAVRLRSPLAAVMGYVDMLLEEELGEVNGAQRHALQTCRRALQRTFRLLDESSADLTLGPTEEPAKQTETEEAEKEAPAPPSQ